MTRPDLDVLESLLAKATPDTLRSALTIWEALPALIARVRELERTQRRDPPDGSTHWDIAEVGAVCHDACAVEQIKAAALAMRERCAQACDAKARQYDRFAMPGDAAVADECAAAVRALEP